jgi:hypothetical protein
MTTTRHGYFAHVLRRLVPLLALVPALAAPIIAEARAGGGHTAGRGSGISRPANAASGVRPVNGGAQLATPTPFPTVQQIRNNNAIPLASTGSSTAGTATRGTSTETPVSTDAPARPNARRGDSVGRTPPFIVSAVVLILAAGSAATIVGFFAFCRYVRRRERQQLRGLREGR